MKNDYINKLTIYLKDNYSFFVSFIALSIYYLSWLLAFYPGVMSADSISHWNEALAHTYTNASPFLYTIIIAVLQLIHRTPALVGIMQITVLSFIIAYILNYAWKRGTNKALLVLVLLFFIIIPQFGIYNITIWKDVLYSYSLLALLFCVFLLTSNENNQTKVLFTSTVVLTTVVALFRFNGLFFIPFIPLWLFIVRKVRLKKAIILLISTSLLYLLVNNGLGSLLQVKKAPLMKEGLTVRTVGSIYQLNNPNLSIQERSIFKQIMPEANWKKYYDCASINVLYYEQMAAPRKLSVYSEIDPNPAFVQAWHTAVITAAIKNPQAIISDKICLSDFLLGFKSYYRYDTGIFNSTGLTNIGQVPKSERLYYFYTNYLYWSVGTFWRAYLLWGTWLALIVIVILSGFAWKNKYFGTLSGGILVIWGTATTVLISPAADYRYVYFVFLSAPVLLVLYFTEKRQLIK